MEQAAGSGEIDIGTILSEFVTPTVTAKLGQTSPTDCLHPAVSGPLKDCGPPDVAMNDIEDCEAQCASLHKKIRKGRGRVGMKAQRDADLVSEPDTSESVQREKSRKFAQLSRGRRNQYEALLKARLDVTEARITYLVQELEHLLALVRQLNRRR